VQTPRGLQAGAPDPSLPARPGLLVVQYLSDVEELFGPSVMVGFLHRSVENVN
jgi:hypothetical protein